MNRLKNIFHEKTMLKELLVEKVIYIVLIALFITVVIIEPKFLSFTNLKIFSPSLLQESSLPWQQVWF